jgi:hypothetical protein
MIIALYIALGFIVLVPIVHSQIPELVDIKVATTLSGLAGLLIAISIGAIAKSNKWKGLLLISIIMGLSIVAVGPTFMSPTKSILTIHLIEAFVLFALFCYYQTFVDKTGSY